VHGSTDGKVRYSGEVRASRITRDSRPFSACTRRACRNVPEGTHEGRQIVGDGQLLKNRVSAAEHVPGQFENEPASLHAFRHRGTTDPFQKTEAVALGPHRKRGTSAASGFDFAQQLRIPQHAPSRGDPVNRRVAVHFSGRSHRKEVAAAEKENVRKVVTSPFQTVETVVNRTVLLSDGPEMEHDEIGGGAPNGIEDCRQLARVGKPGTDFHGQTVSRAGVP